MAATTSSHVPPLSLYTFRERDSNVCQRTKFWPLKIEKHCVYDIKLSCDVKPCWNFSIRCASGTFTSVNSSETNDVGRDEARFDRGGKNLEGFEVELQELFDEVKSMIAAGNEDGAEELLRANFEAAKERINSGEKGIEEAALIDVIALGYMTLGDLKFVNSLLGTLNEVVDGLTDDEQILDPILVHMASMYSKLGKFEKSVIGYQRAIDIMEKKYGKNSVFLVTPYLGIAKALGSTRKTTKAIEFYHRAITVLELSRGAESEDLVLPLFGLGNLLLQERKSKDAETLFLRILNIYTALYGKCDGRVAMAMCSLAHAKCAMGNTDEAISLYRNALEVIKDSNYMAMDDNVAEKIRTDLAELLHAVGRGKEGRDILQESLLIAEKSRGKEDPSLVTHMVNLATSHLRSKNYAEAEHLLRTSLQVMAKSMSTDDQAITFPMLHLAVTLYHLKRDEEAEQLALEVLRIRERAFGKGSLPVAEALDCLVSIQNRLARDDGESLEKLKRVLRIQEREFGNESSEVLETLKKMAFYVDKLGMKDEKLSLQKRLSMLRMKFKHRIQY